MQNKIKYLKMDYEKKKSAEHESWNIWFLLTKKMVSHRVSCTVRRGAFTTSDAESKPLVISDQAGGESLLRSTGGWLQVEGEATAASLPWEVVVFRPQRRSGDGVLWFHHMFP